MSSSSTANLDPESKYSRKEKSLGLLATKFLKLYNRDGVDSIGVDNAATELGVERRRIYDIANILERIGVLSKRAKNQYTWKGFSGIPRALYILQQQGIGEKYNTPSDENLVKVKEEYEDLELPKSRAAKQEKASEPNKIEHRREKSLGLLTENFVKLLICSDEKLITFEYAAAALLGDMCNQTSSKTKVRRLYDIANVFTSMNLIEKLRHPETGKPAFRWIGVDGNSRKRFTSENENYGKRRIFGTEITNTVIKRCKDGISSGKKENEHLAVPLPAKHDIVKDKGKIISTEQQRQRSSDSFVFGPFTPALVPKVGVSATKKAREAPDWENLASTYRPRYSNQGVNELFAHYADAWKKWNAEALEKKRRKAAS